MLPCRNAGSATGRRVLVVLGLWLGIGGCFGDDLSGPDSANYLFDGFAVVATSGSTDTDATHEAFWVQAVDVDLRADDMFVAFESDAPESGEEGGAWTFYCDH